MIDRKEIIISENTKGILVFATLPNSFGCEWLILIKNVYKRVTNKCCLAINRYISYNITTHEIHFDNGHDAAWGKIDGYQFYEPTDEEKKFIAQELAKRGYKFVPILNKVLTYSPP